MNEDDKNNILKNLGKIMCELRHLKGLNQKEVEQELHFTDKTVSRIENGTNSTAFDKIVQLMNFYDATMDDIIKIFGRTTVDEKEKTYDFSNVHLRRLEQYTDQHYRCYYFSTMSNENQYDSLDIFTDAMSNNGYLSGYALHKGYKYSCKIVSPADYKYTFIYLTSMGTLNDRAIIILPFISAIRNKFNAGAGILFSFSAEGEIPCFQKTVILYSPYQKNKYLAHNLISKKMNDILQLKKCGEKIIKVDNLEKESKELHKLCIEEQKRKGNQKTRVTVR